jgi:F-type H+-transporting ATPase subunit delta
MLSNKIIARRYAKGLLLSLPEDSLKNILEQLEILSGLLDSQSDFRLLCEDPNFSQPERKEVFEKMAEKFGLNNIFYNFLLLLTDKSRLSLLPEICEEFQDLLDEHEGRLQVIITSATPVLESEMREISEILMRANKKKEVHTRHVIDKDLLGGMRIEAAGAVFDGSLKAKLDALKSKLIQEIGQ